MAETLISPGIAISEVDQSAIPPRPLVAGAAIIGPTVKGKVNVPTKVTSYADYQRTFGDVFMAPVIDPETKAVEEEQMPQEFLTSMAAKSFFEQGGDSLLVVRVAPDGAFTPAISTNAPSSGSGLKDTVFELETLSAGKYLNNASGPEAWTSASREEYAYESGALISGSRNNISWQVFDVNEDRGTFGLVIRRGDDDDLENIVLETWRNLSLDPLNVNYISRIIGDQKESCVDTPDGPVVKVEGDYPNVSKYVRIKSVFNTPNYLDADEKPRMINGEPASAYLPIEGQRGGFYNAKGVVGHCYVNEEGVEDPVDYTESGSAQDHYFKDLMMSPDKYDFNQTVKPEDYATAIHLLENSDEYQINIVSAPGLIGGKMVDLLTALAQGRGDCIAPVDICEFDTDVAAVAMAAQQFNNSYASTYWPWLQMISATGRYVWVPASTVIPGIYTYTDHQTAPWFAPAGMTRGGVQGVIQTSQKLTKKDRDVLYNKNVNPIATMPGAGIVVYGQKTLQKKASALDRVNVRRLLIEVKDTVRKMAAGLLFEQNTTALQNQFKSQVDPYLASIVQRKGLVGYRIDLSENSDPNVVDRNEFRCGITLQPTKTIEFIYLTFTVTATGVSFD